MSTQSAVTMQELGQPGPSRFGSGYEGLMRGDQAYLFDCHLFGVSPPEAVLLDPQTRQLLKTDR